MISIATIMKRCKTVLSGFKSHSPKCLIKEIVNLGIEGRNETKSKTYSVKISKACSADTRFVSYSVKERR